VRSSRLAGVPVPPPTSSLHFSSRVLGSWKWGGSERDKLWVEDGDVVELFIPSGGQGAKDCYVHPGNRTRVRAYTMNLP
jgi:hypothetical protein